MTPRLQLYCLELGRAVFAMHKSRFTTNCTVWFYNCTFLLINCTIKCSDYCGYGAWEHFSSTSESGQSWTAKRYLVKFQDKNLASSSTNFSLQGLFRKWNIKLGRLGGTVVTCVTNFHAEIIHYRRNDSSMKTVCVESVHCHCIFHWLCIFQRLCIFSRHGSIIRLLLLSQLHLKIITKFYKVISFYT